MLQETFGPDMAAHAAKPGSGGVQHATAKRADGAERAARAAPTILMVEDNEFLATTMQMMLEGIGYHVKHADRAQAALDMLDRDGPIDLLFSDIVMPGDMDGLDLARIVRDRTPEVPIILATGYANAAQQAITEGFF